MLDKLASLPPFTQSVALQKATEPPFSGCFTHVPPERGTYLCRRCGLGLWDSTSQFGSHCGWPSFDDRLNSNIVEHIDDDGFRTEIICKRCSSHLGHVFRGEGYTDKNQRDCVNSVMLDFVPYPEILDTEEIIIAGGCFWGIQDKFNHEQGVVFTECGYTGGHLVSPSYEDVCLGKSGHYEAVRVIFDSNKTSSLALLKAFFNMHNPRQKEGQGPDIGQQYQSAVFYYNASQQQEAQKTIAELEHHGSKVYTKILTVSTFWPAEDYHQNYNAKKRCLLS